MKADKLRQVANKYVRDLNDPVMDSNLQVCPSFAIGSGILLCSVFLWDNFQYAIRTLSCLE